MVPIKEYVEIRKVQIKEEVEALIIKPKLVIVQVGNVEASNRYVKNKMKDCAECGVPCELLHLNESITEVDLLSTVIDLNNNPTVTGFIVQLPLPKHIRESIVIEAIDPKKDVDGFSPLSKTIPATPLGIYRYLKDMNYDFRGKNCVILGRSAIVGRPAHKLLLDADMNVTILHTKTSEEDKKFYIEHADLIIVATGHLHTLTNTYKFKSDTIIIDVGINIDENGKLTGDCDKDLPVAFQSPVPGGVGLLTRIAVIDNLIALIK